MLHQIVFGVAWGSDLRTGLSQHTYDMPTEKPMTAGHHHGAVAPKRGAGLWHAHRATSVGRHITDSLKVPHHTDRMEAMSRLRVALTFDHCWRTTPGGTGVASVELASALMARGDVDVVGVAGNHRRPATAGFEPPVTVARLPLRGTVLVESTLRLGWPLVERATGHVDVLHATSIIPLAARQSTPLVVTVHDLAFLHHPGYFTARGRRVFGRALAQVRERATLILCSSQATLADCVENGVDPARLRLVPLGVRVRDVTSSDIAAVRARLKLPEQFLLFVGTREPRKNLQRLLAAHESLGAAVPPLVIVGARGWGDDVADSYEASDRVHFVGHVASHELAAVYSSAAALCYPSVMEGFGLPILEAMAHGTPVLTSRGTSTEEVAAGAAVLVDPLDVSAIAAGIREVLARRAELSQAGRARASGATWQHTADLVVHAYHEAVEMGSRRA